MKFSEFDCGDYQQSNAEMPKWRDYRVRSAFWRDLEKDLQDPEFFKEYILESSYFLYFKEHFCL